MMSQKLYMYNKKHVSAGQNPGILVCKVKFSFRATPSRRAQLQATEEKQLDKLPFTPAFFGSLWATEGVQWTERQEWKS